MRTIMLILAAGLLFNTGPAIADQLRLGAVFSLSGLCAEGGREELNGVIMAVEDLCAGDSGSTCPKLVVEDNKSIPAETARAVSKLLNSDDVSAIIGPNWSEFIDIAAPLAKTLHVPLVTATGFKLERLEEETWVFVLWPRPEMATQALVSYISAQKVKKLAVAVSETAYYSPMLEAMKPQLEAEGIGIISTGFFAPGSFDYRSWIAKVRKEEPDGILALLQEDGSFSSFLRQRKDLGFLAPVFAANTLPYDPVARENLQLVEGLVYFDYIVAGDPGWKARYRERFKTDPGMGSARAYDGVRILVHAYEQCGNARNCIRDVLRTINWKGVSCTIHFDPKGALVTSVPHGTLFEVKNGRIHPL